MTTWNDIKRSETPWNWRKLLDELTITPKKLNAFINKEIENKNKKDEKEKT